MKKSLFLTVALFIQANLWAQKSPAFSYFSTGSNNPALAGLGDWQLEQAAAPRLFSCKLTHAQQWAGFPGAPVGSNLEAKTGSLRHGLAFGIAQQTAGAWQSGLVSGAYRYGFALDRRRRQWLHLGLGASFAGHHLKTGLLTTRDPDDPFIGELRTGRYGTGQACGGVFYEKNASNNRSGDRKWVAQVSVQLPSFGSSHLANAPATGQAVLGYRKTWMDGRDNELFFAPHFFVEKTTGRPALIGCAALLGWEGRVWLGGGLQRGFMGQFSAGAAIFSGKGRLEVQFLRPVGPLRKYAPMSIGVSGSVLLSD